MLRRTVPDAKRTTRYNRQMMPRGPASGFYEEALVGEALKSVESGTGDVGDEMWELRQRLREVLAQRPDEVKLLLRGTDVLARAAAAEYRMSSKGRKELAASVQAVLDGLGEQLL